MRTPSDDLFNLIHSLTKREKLYFKRFWQNHKKEQYYMKLFDLIKNCSVYDEDSVKKKSKIPNFANVKNTLFNAILTSMRECHSQNSIEIQIREDITNIELLFVKNLRGAAEKLIEKNIEKAQRSGKYEYLIELWTLKTLAFNVSYYKNTTLEKLQTPFRLIKSTLDNIKTAQFYYDQSNLILYHVSKGLPITGIQHLTAKEISVIEKKYAHSFRVLNELYKYLDYYFNDIKKDPGKSFEFTLKRCELIEKNNLTELYAESYLQILYNLGLYKVGLGKYDETQQLLDKLKDHVLAKKNKSYRKQYLYYSLALVYYTKTNQVQKGLTLIRSLNTETINNFQTSQKQIIYKRAAQFCFFAKQYKLSNKFLNYLMECGTNDMRALAEIIKIIIRFEHQDYDFVIYSSNSLFKNLKKQKMLFPFEESLLDFFRTETKKLLLDHNKIHFLKELKKRVEMLDKQYLTRGMYTQFDFKGWMEGIS